MSSAIAAQNLGKRYSLRHQAGPSYVALRDVVAEGVQHVRHRLSRAEDSEKGSGNREEFWALQDVSFSIQEGERVGVIGRNGAGKSTLLKILSRITCPTTGRVRVRGRVASLLEVGTGFHPELTGRENIYLNGAVLGMRRREIRAQFDEIVAFAEVERFLDTPVKRYSSGMYVRLAFAVAAHLPADILIVDEVLAVGDSSFQKKCLSAMETVGQAGRTVLFVSHSMPAIARLCDRAILLDRGQVVIDGPVPRVIGAYMRAGLGTTVSQSWPRLESAPGNDIVRLRAVRARNQNGLPSDSLDIRQPIIVEMEYDVLIAGHVLVPNLNFSNEAGVCVFAAVELDPEWHRRPRPTGRFLSTAQIPGNFLAEGSLSLRAAISTLDPFIVHVDVPDAVVFHVVDSLDGDSARGDYGGPMPGVVRPLLPWTSRLVRQAREELPV